MAFRIRPPRTLRWHNDSCDATT